ncbi:DUF1330 domain-containing protein [Pseudomonas sp. P5_A2_2]
MTSKKGYLFAELDVVDAAYFYNEYMPRVHPILEEYGAVFLAGSDAPVVKEGGRDVRRVVLLEFESLQRAEEFYHSERYQSIIGYRFKSARSHLYIFEASSGAQPDRAEPSGRSIVPGLGKF